MQEKNEMQIVVTADDSQAKTKLQKLSNYLKNNFRKKEKMNIDLNTNFSKAKLIQINDTINKLKSEIKNIDLETDSKAFRLWADQLSDAEMEAAQRPCGKDAGDRQKIRDFGDFSSRKAGPHDRSGKSGGKRQEFHGDQQRLRAGNDGDGGKQR